MCPKTISLACKHTHQLNMHIHSINIWTAAASVLLLVRPSFRLTERIFPSPLKRKQLPVTALLCYPFTRLQPHISRSSSGACILCSPACFSVIAHHCCLCARASNNGLSWSCSTCFAEAFKSFHYRNCFIIFLWLIYNGQNCNRLHIRLCSQRWEEFP